MPFLRFSRDKRGYENTYIVHSFRRRGKKRSRILYWFRTPPNVRVGRAPLDEDAIRSIEESNPELAFDWTKILESQPAPAQNVETPRSPRRRASAGAPRAQAAAPPSEAPAPEGKAGKAGKAGKTPTAARSDVSPVAPPAGDRLELIDVRELGGRLESRDSAGSGAPESPESPESPDTDDNGDNRDIGDDGLRDDARDGGETADAERLPPSKAGTEELEALVGAEGVARLRARFAELQARLSERGGDPARLEALRLQAEPLNPDTWVTADEARLGLEQFEARFEELRRALGRRRRSRRGGVRHRRRRQAAAAAPPAKT